MSITNSYVGLFHKQGTVEEMEMLTFSTRMAIQGTRNAKLADDLRLQAGEADGNFCCSPPRKHRRSSNDQQHRSTSSQHAHRLALILVRSRTSTSQPRGRGVWTTEG